MTDHLWLNYTKGFQALGQLTAGDKIQFEARIKEYWKGYVGNRTDEFGLPLSMSHPPRKDYKLSHPTKIKRVF